uniref:Phospholipid/glycerol acyltransferase domain-containing protein n=1 Tax=uncultured bacterium fosmid pJB84G2 TaxID=1478072 RepID=A0A0H3U8A7_9BACT|nr:hypothetical protein [uncultured bacterium fosmid pJB84G2]
MILKRRFSMVIINKIVKWFLKATGIFPYFLYLKPRFVFASEKAKKEFKDNRDGVIIVCNHTRILDYYCLMLKFFFRTVHTFVADVVYHIRGLSYLNKVMENIRINRDGSSNIVALSKASEYLKKKKIILIFPEGKLEDKKGKIEKLSTSSALLAIENNKAIIPIYTDGKYGFFKRPTFMVGEKIYPFNNDDLEASANEMTEKIKETLLHLKAKTKCANEYKTKRIFTTKYWMLDFIKITSIPVFYLLFPTKKYYLCKRKEIHNAFKYNAIICGNHFGPCDPLFMYLHFLSRRIKVISIEQLWENKIFRFAMERGGVIKYHRDSMNRIDVVGLKEALDTLEGNGVVGLFPEGHINFNLKFDDDIKGGAAMMSLITNSPIIPFVFANQYRLFKMNKVIIGKPIYPTDYFDLNKPVDTNEIYEYNKIIYKQMKSMYDLSLEKRKNHGK